MEYLGKVALRPAVPQDARMIYEWLAHSDATPSMLGPPNFPDEPVPTWDEFLEDYQPHYFDGSAPLWGRCFVIMAEGKPVGQVNHGEIDLDRRRTELDIWIGAERHTGQGLGPDALETMTDYLHRQFGLVVFVIRPSARNPRAIRAYEKAGFRRVDIAPDEAAREFGPGGYSDDVVLIKAIGAIRT